MGVFCIIGTDTEVGKTYSCCQIMKYLAGINYKSVTLKPVASGLIHSGYGPINEDVYQLLKASNYPLPITQINPICFAEPVAPHIAAQKYGQQSQLNVQSIVNLTAPTIAESRCKVHSLLIEGVGGLMVPLNSEETYLDLLKRWQYSVILVVGMKLGCLNHSLLTHETLIRHNVKLAGWIANQIDPQMAYFEENLAYLTTKLNSPLLAIIPYKGTLEPTINFSEVLLDT